MTAWGRSWPRATGTALAVLGSLLALVGRVGAHGDGDGHGTAGIHPAVPASVFLGSVLVLGTAVYLDHVGALPRRLADAGVTIGVVGLLASVSLLLV